MASPPAMDNAKPKRRALKLLLICLSAAAVFGIVFLLWPKLVHWSSPKYKGKTAEEWLPAFSHEINYEVVNAFGTNAAERVARVLVQKETLHQKVWPKLPAFVQGALKAFRPPDFRNNRRAASFWLHALGPDARSALPILTNYVAKEGLFVHTLAHIAPGDPFVAQLAGKLLTSPVSSSRVSALTSLRPFGTNAAVLVPTLTNILASPRSEAPLNVLSGLGGMGPTAKETVPFIRPYLMDTNTRGNALYAIQEIGPAAVEAVPELTFLLTNTRDQMQLQAAYCLFLVGADSSAALPALKTLRRAETNLLQLLVWCSLGVLENDRPSAVEKIRQVLTSPLGAQQSAGIILHFQSDQAGYAYHVRAVSVALRIAADNRYVSEELLPAIEALLNDRNPEIQALARGALWRQTGDSARCAPLILEVLQEGKVYRVHMALGWLQEMQLTEAHVPRLLKFFNNHENRWKDRKQVLKLIRRIDPPTADRLKMSSL